MDAADPQRQAHRARGGEDRRRHGERGADRPRRGASLRVDARARSISSSTRRSIRRRTKQLLAQGLAASPGAASGEVVFNADDAEAAAQHGEKVILVRVETSPEDIHGMQSREGILTARGGMTSHAAVVARGMGKRCVAGCGALDDRLRATAQFTRRRRARSRRGDLITLDGSTGEVFRGQACRRSQRHGESGEFGDAHGLGRQGAPPEGARQRRHAARRRGRAPLRRRGHRPLPHRAHVLRRRSASTRCAR